MALDSNLVISRRNAFACCAATASSNALSAIIVGDKDCYDKYMRTAAWYRWGADVMARTAATGDCCGPLQCVTDDFAMAVIRKLDALDGCVKCGCGGPDDRPIVCEIQQDYTVAAAVDASYQYSANPILPYFIVTNLNSWPESWASNVGKIVVNTTFTTIDIGKVIYDEFLGQYWIQTSGGPGLYFPQINGALVSTTLTVNSAYPLVNAMLQRDIVVEVSVDGTTWTPVYSGNENGVNGTTYTVPAETLFIRSRYFYAEDNTCSTPFADGLFTVDANPPLSGRSYQFPPNSNIEGTDANFSFTPWFEPQWRVSFWSKFDQSTLASSTEEAQPFGMFNQRGGFTDYTQMFIRRGEIYPNSYIFSFECTVYGTTSERSFTTGSIPGFDPSLWHNVRLVKSALGNPQANDIGDFKFYVDGVQVPLQLTFSGGGDQALVTWNDGTVQINRRTSIQPTTMYVDEIYMDDKADTDGNTVLLTNLMQQAYGSGWLFWYRAELPDDLTAPPWSTPNAPNAPYLRALQGAPTISTDVPPQLT